MFILDNVIHLYDLSDDNVRKDRPDARVSRDEAVRWSAPIRDSLGQTGRFAEPDFSWARRWEIEDMYDLVFRGSPTDMAMAQVVPMFDWFKNWYAPVMTQYAMAAAYPDRVLFCGGVDPNYRGLQDALNNLDSQVRELGACSIKFYNGHGELKDSWRCDDERLAYPLYERCRQLGIRVLQFHKGNPHGLQNMEPLSPVDLQQAARDFPDLSFVVHHLALPYFEELLSIAGRFPNVYVSLAGHLGLYRVAPRYVQEHMGRLLQVVGVDKILWGSEAALAGGPAPMLQAFMELEIPDDLRAGYGYPQITRADKQQILGLNFARLLGIDVEAKKRELGLAVDAA